MSSLRVEIPVLMLSPRGGEPLDGAGTSFPPHTAWTLADLPGRTADLGNRAAEQRIIEEVTRALAEHLERGR
jgi:hypothetical protein